MKNVAKIMLPILFLLAIMIVKPSYAYWSNSVTPSMFNTTANVFIGEWLEYWDETIVYQKNDLIIYDGDIYIALKRNRGKIPNSNAGSNFWAIYNDF